MTALGQTRRWSNAIGMSASPLDSGHVAALPRTVERGQEQKCLTRYRTADSNRGRHDLLLDRLESGFLFDYHLDFDFPGPLEGERHREAVIGPVRLLHAREENVRIA